MEQELTREQIQWERMLPAEFRQAQAKLPVLFLPLGTVEWHGEHNALGLDSLKAHELLVRTARKAGGGVVHPPLYGGMGGLDKPATVIIEGEYDWDNVMLRPWIEKLCEEAVRNGFKAIIIVTGHYGHNQQIVVREAAVRMTERLQVPVLGVPEYWLALDAGYWGDHAGIGETSLLWHLHPDLVAMDRIKEDPDYGVTDEIEKGSSPELGERYAELITDRLAALAGQMLQWDEATREAYADSERTILRMQLKGWRQVGPWEFWRHMAYTGMAEYGKLLLENKFSEIARRAKLHREQPVAEGTESP
ncbi:creatininase family protein [Paenibacillus gansuensis]|uniref:Creatininase family protein n=1 Tax=Paenibacillus gansuensis TaxID=306542 RepID=A0ABW5PB16_9BACL